MLNAILHHHITNNHGEFTNKLLDGFYADNLCTGAQDSETAIRLFNKTNDLFNKCSMNIRSWAINDHAV